MSERVLSDMDAGFDADYWEKVSAIAEGSGLTEEQLKQMYDIARCSCNANKRLGTTFENSMRVLSSLETITS